MGIIAHGVLVALVLMALCLAAMPLAHSISGADGVWSALAAAIVVWLASVAGMAIGELFSGTSMAATKLLAGMVIRMAIPLVACLMALVGGERLAGSGFVFYVLFFYLVALPIEAGVSYCKSVASQSKQAPES